MAIRPPKLTRVGRALLNAGDEPVALPIAPRDLGSPTFVPRLSFRSGPRLPREQSQIEAGFSQLRGEALFIDSSIVQRDPDEPLWRALLAEPGRVFLTPQVVQELHPHLLRHPRHPLAVAIRNGDPALVPTTDPAPGDPGSVVRDYYLRLLAVRRLALKGQYRAWEREHGAPPDESARATIAARAQRDIGERGFMLNTKPLSPLGTDEALVYAAVAHALRTGQGTRIVAADHDVEEQFFMLVELLTMHYFASLVAQAYIRNPAEFHPTPAPPGLMAKTTQLFRSATMLDLRGRRVHDFLSNTFSFVPISCTLVDRLRLRGHLWRRTREGSRARHQGPNPGPLDQSPRWMRYSRVGAAAAAA